jgi:hypothetical protein
MRFSVLAPIVILSAAAAGCGGSDAPDPNDPSQMQGQYGAQGQYGYPSGQYGQQQQYPQQQYPQQQTPQQPAPQQPAPQQGGGGQATPIAPAMAAAATPIMQGMAMSETPGMQPDGAAFAGQFSQGQVLEQPFNIQPGKCYSVVAVGIGITELDVMIQVQPVPAFPAQTLAQDNMSGAQAVLGGKGNCFKNPLPVGGPAKVVMKATGGSGMAIGQLYSK